MNLLNEYQQTLYDALEVLVASTETFYRQEFELDGEKYWIYNYRLSSYSDFLLPGGMEARGIMFRITNGLELVSLPMSKFFNLNENPITMNLDLSKVDVIQVKADGSLISTYLHQGKLMLKSKGSLTSDQAMAAMHWLNGDQPGPSFLREYLRTVANAGITVNLEWTAPDNRIVIGYLEPMLTILNCRRMTDGAYVDPFDPLEDGVTYHSTNLLNFVIPEVFTNNPEAFIRSIPDMTEDVEGYVAKMTDGLWFKCKTLKYLSLHHAKDSVNNPRRLFEAVLDEGVDDLLSMFAGDALAVQLIHEMQARVDVLYNHMVSVVEKFHNDNKGLSRKDYAIKGQAEVDKMYFGLVMNKYLDAPMDYKGFLKSRWKDLGLKDAAVNAE